MGLSIPGRSSYRAAPAGSHHFRFRQRRLELREGDRLAQELQPRLPGSPLVLRLRGPADQHDRRRAAPRPYGLGNLEARQARHEEVRDHDLVDERVEARQAIAPVHGHLRLMSQQLDEFREDVPDLRLILDHEHFHFLPVNVSSRRGVGWPS